MKIAVVGSTGRIGAKVVPILRNGGHEILELSRSDGFDPLRRSDVRQALAGMEVVLDTLDSPSADPSESRWFLETTTANLLFAESAAGVRHHVVASMVGAGRVGAGHFAAKWAQEARVAASRVPYTIVRATQTFEALADLIASPGSVGAEVALPEVPMQPVAADDVAVLLATVATGAPWNRVVEVSGPDRLQLDELGRSLLAARGDRRPVKTVGSFSYLGAEFASGDTSLLPGAVVAPTTLVNWLAKA